MNKNSCALACCCLSGAGLQYWAFAIGMNLCILRIRVVVAMWDGDLSWASSENVYCCGVMFKYRSGEHKMAQTLRLTFMNPWVPTLAYEILVDRKWFGASLHRLVETKDELKCHQTRPWVWASHQAFPWNWCYLAVLTWVDLLHWVDHRESRVRLPAIESIWAPTDLSTFLSQMQCSFHLALTLAWDYEYIATPQRDKPLR